jgi:hypothetical protein
MKTRRLSYPTRLALLCLPAAAALVVGLAPGCSSSNPSPPSSGTSSSSSSGAGGAGGASTSASSTTTTASGTGGGGTSSSGGTGGGDGGPACVPDGGATGCYSCPPKTNDEFLNACAPNGDQCTHFDNATSLPFWDGGALPVP